MMANQDWDKLFEGKSVQEALKILVDKIESEVSKCIPRIKAFPGKVGLKPMWMNGSGLKKIKKKHKAWRRYLNTKDGQDYQKYAKIRNECKTMMTKLIKTFESELAKDISQSLLEVC
jgi:hypothetical protein